MRAVQDEARSREVERVWLEVIVENAKAIALYEELGYGHVGDLEVWSVAGGGASDGPAVTEVDAAEARAWIREHRTEREPWQRDDASLAKVADAQGLRVDGAAAVIRVAGTRVQLV